MGDIIKIEGVYWFHLVQDTNKWPVLQNVAMGPQFPQIKGVYLTNKRTVIFSERNILTGGS